MTKINFKGIYFVLGFLLLTNVIYMQMGKAERRGYEKIIEKAKNDGVDLRIDKTLNREKDVSLLIKIEDGNNEKMNELNKLIVDENNVNNRKAKNLSDDTIAQNDNYNNLTDSNEKNSTNDIYKYTDNIIRNDTIAKQEDKNYNNLFTSTSSSNITIDSNFTSSNITTNSSSPYTPIDQNKTHPKNNTNDVPIWSDIGNNIHQGTGPAMLQFFRSTSILQFILNR